MYFPTETESKLDFIIQGPYRTTPNRSSIPAEDKDNIFLAQETAELLDQSIFELKKSGKLNMSFIKALPISKEKFESFGLFLPLYKKVHELFSSYAVIPSKSGKYVYARYAKIVRQERLTNVLTDDLLAHLINDGHQYYWLPTYLTETNREYRPVFDFLTGVLHIPIVRPEDLRIYIDNNPNFLPEQSDDWLIELYGIFENVPAAFSKSRYETNMLTSAIVKTKTGAFVAPFRKEGKSYIPNVFLPSPKIHSTDIHFVDETIYEMCRHFFDDILQLQKPNEYEFLIKDIKKRYESGAISNDEQHIEDIRTLLKYVKYDDYRDEVSRIIRENLALYCTDGTMRCMYTARIFLPISTDGINIEAYYRNVVQKVYFVDLDFYGLHDIDALKLVELGVRNNLITGDKTVHGTYETGAPGKAPEWWTVGDFRWKMSVDSLKEVLVYISKHPTAKDTILKSQTIMRLLVLNETRLCGRVNIGGSKISNLENESCEMIHILRGERMINWDGKWLFTESGELVSPKSISKHEISTDIYGRIKTDSIIFHLLSFKKTEADEVDDLKKEVPKEKLDAFFESELRQRYGISTADLNERFGGTNVNVDITEDSRLPFPIQNVRSWDALRKHTAEMLIYADPVQYDEKVRRIRISNRPREARAYLQNMYRHEGNNRFKFACQLCHDTCSSFEATEVFLRPETELDPMNLCLCSNCATKYRKIRSDSNIMEMVRNTFLKKKENEIESGDYVAIKIDEDDELWFTQTHFAEIRELMLLAEEVKNSKNEPPAQISTDDENEEDGLTVYHGYIGKTIKRKDGFVGKVTDISTSGKTTLLIVEIISGERAGEQTKIQLSFLLGDEKIYEISD